MARTQPSRVDLAALLPVLRCPASGGSLQRTPDGGLVSEDGAHRYVVADGVPLLIDAERSLFDPVAELAPDGGVDGRSRLRARIWAVGRKVVPSISLNVAADENFSRLGELLGGAGTRRVLLVGGAIEGYGVERLVSLPYVETVETDVVVGPRTQVLADAHDLPFADGTFDAVVCQGVLGNVADPQRVADEIHRVLAPDGYVYAETNFLQGVCMGPYDFTRFTHVGHRRLFRRFDEVSSGVQCGPGMMLAWAITWFLMSLGGRSRVARLGLRATAPYLVFWLKYLDPYLVDKPGAYDAASGVFFLGRRSTTTLPDREILRTYRGAVRTEWIDERHEAEAAH